MPRKRGREANHGRRDTRRHQLRSKRVTRTNCGQVKRLDGRDAANKTGGTNARRQVLVRERRREERGRLVQTRDKASALHAMRFTCALRALCRNKSQAKFKTHCMTLGNNYKKSLSGHVIGCQFVQPNFLARTTVFKRKSSQTP